jgi:Na+-driven multidrug efflux pump
MIKLMHTFYRFNCINAYVVFAFQGYNKDRKSLYVKSLTKFLNFTFSSIFYVYYCNTWPQKCRFRHQHCQIRTMGNDTVVNVKNRGGHF